MSCDEICCVTHPVVNDPMRNGRQKFLYNFPKTLRPIVATGCEIQKFLLFL